MPRKKEGSKWERNREVGKGEDERLGGAQSYSYSFQLFSLALLVFDFFFLRLLLFYTDTFSFFSQFWQDSDDDDVIGQEWHLNLC